MSYNTNFDLTGLTGSFSSNDTFRYRNTGTMGNPFNGGNGASLGTQSGQYVDPSIANSEWYLQPPENGGPTQPYTGVEVIGDLNNFPDPTSVGPSPLYRASLNGGHNPPFYAGIRNPSSRFATLPPFPVPAPPSAPTLSWPYYHSTSHAVPSAVTANSPTFPYPIPNYPDNMGLDTNATGPSTQPAAQIPHYVPPEEHYGCGSQAAISDPDPFGFSSVAPASITNNTGVTSPETSFPCLAPSSSGPRRTTKRGKGKRKHDPLDLSARKNGANRGECVEDWSAALIRFQSSLTEIILDEQLYEVLSFETALAAEMTKFIKDDLKRSPLQDTKAGDGKRPRDIEDYLTAILREIIQNATPEEGRSREIHIKGAFYSKVADRLEASLLPVNTNSTLRQPPLNATSQVGKGARLEQTEERVKKNKREKLKRDGQRSQLQRMGYLFKVAKPGHCWTRTEVLSFVVVFFLCGSGIFSPGFVSEASA